MVYKKHLPELPEEFCLEGDLADMFNPVIMAGDTITVVESDDEHALIAVHRKRDNAGHIERYDFRKKIPEELVLLPKGEHATFPLREGTKLQLQDGHFITIDD